MSIIPITDFDDPQLDIYARRSEGQLLHFMNPKKVFLLLKVHE